MPTCSTNFLLFRYVVDFLVEENDFKLVSVPGGSKLTSFKLEHLFFVCWMKFDSHLFRLLLNAILIFSKPFNKIWKIIFRFASSDNSEGLRYGRGWRTNPGRFYFLIFVTMPDFHEKSRTSRRLNIPHSFLFFFFPQNADFILQLSDLFNRKQILVYLKDKIISKCFIGFPT
jgi:hypothetical protein